jgi:hypothetical protein
MISPASLSPGTNTVVLLRAWRAVAWRMLKRHGSVAAVRYDDARGAPALIEPARWRAQPMLLVRRRDSLRSS